MSAPPPSDSTRQLLDHLWSTFVQYCELVGESSLPASPSTVAGFLLAERERLAPATLRRTLRAIALRHEVAGESDPTNEDDVQSTMHGIEEGRLLQLADPPQIEVADPSPHPDIMRMVDALADALLDLRDRALLLTGATAKLSKAALVSLQFEGVREKPRHLDLEVTDHGTKRVYRISKEHDANDVKAAIKAWGSAAGITSGPVFRSVDRWGNVSEEAMAPQSVGAVVRRAAERAGFDRTPAVADLFHRRP